MITLCWVFIKIALFRHTGFVKFCQSRAAAPVIHDARCFLPLNYTNLCLNSWSYCEISSQLILITGWNALYWTVLTLKDQVKLTSLVTRSRLAEDTSEIKLTICSITLWSRICVAIVLLRQMVCACLERIRSKDRITVDTNQGCGGSRGV